MRSGGRRGGPKRAPQTCAEQRPRGYLGNVGLPVLRQDRKASESASVRTLDRAVGLPLDSTRQLPRRPPPTVTLRSAGLVAEPVVVLAAVLLKLGLQAFPVTALFVEQKLRHLWRLRQQQELAQVREAHAVAGLIRLASGQLLKERHQLPLRQVVRPVSRLAGGARGRGLEHSSDRRCRPPSACRGATARRLEMREQSRHDVAGGRCRPQGVAVLRHVCVEQPVRMPRTEPPRPGQPRVAGPSFVPSQMKKRR